MSTEIGNGGVFHIEALFYVHIKSTGVTFDMNSAGTDATSTEGNGGVFSVIEGLTFPVDATFDSVTFSNNQAKMGSGGVLYIPKTSTTSVVTVVKTILFSNQANIDGGALFIGGTGDKLLKIEDCDNI